MYALVLPADAGEAEFREAARRALGVGVKPQDIAFSAADTLLFEPLAANDNPPALTAPRAFVELMADAICHRAEDRFALLYEILWRIKHGEPQLLERAADPMVAKLSQYAKAVRRDIHKMHAFVRFHREETGDGEVFLAWFEPAHFILRRAAPFFVERFANMRWIIATPDGTALWDTHTLIFETPRAKPENLQDGVLDTLWRTYYRTIFNPARLKPNAMAKEMPKRYWKNMPETAQIPELVAQARSRVKEMDREPDAAPRFADKAKPKPKLELPPAEALHQLRADAARCTACPLHQHATQTVFGEGPANARIMFVGEQPGDQEDIAGKPFVGPAGQLLDRGLCDAGIDRRTVYVTNAVKHFKFEPRGKRRIHSKPDVREIMVCRTWLAREIEAIEPDLVVALGGTAAQALSGKAAAITKLRGRALAWADGRRGSATVHPSYLLRIPDQASKDLEYEKFVMDLKLAAALAAHSTAPQREQELV